MFLVTNENMGLCLYMRPQTNPVLFGALPDFIFLLQKTIINSSVGNHIFRNQEHKAICEVGKFSLFFGPLQMGLLQMQEFRVGRLKT